MADDPNNLNSRPKQPEGNPSRKPFVPVRSKYLDFTKKNTSESDHSGPSKMKVGTMGPASDLPRAGPPKGQANSTMGGNNSRLRISKGAAKTSTPTKDISLFSADVSVVSVGNEPKLSNVKQESLGDLSEKAFIEYNNALLLRAFKVIVDEQTAEFQKEGETQVNMLQRAVNESALTLSNLELQIDVETALDELQEDVTVVSEAFNEIIENPAVLDLDSFEDLISELNGVLDQLPCKNVRVPSSQQDIDEIENAGAALSKTLEDALEKHRNEITTTSGITEQISKLDSACNSLQEVNASFKKLLPLATSKVLDETAQCLMSSGVGNMKVQF